MKPRDDCEVSVSQLEIQPRAFCRRRHITEIIRSCALDLSTLLKGERIFLPPKTMSKWPQCQTLQFLLIFMLACVTPHKNHRQRKNNVDIHQPTLLSVCGSCLFFFLLCEFVLSLPPSLPTVSVHLPVPFYWPPAGHSQPVWPKQNLAVPLHWISCLPAWTLGRNLCIDPWGC